MNATAIPYSSLPLKATERNQRAELTSVAMADFTSAIVEPLVSPIRTVATQKLDAEYTSPPLISQELGALRI
jgi:hypothetical protein